MRIGQYEIDCIGLAKEINQSRIEAAEAQIVSYMRIELPDCCPVCEEVQGLNISADDTATYEQYELLHFNCRGLWWANYENELGADIIDWKEPSVELRAEWMNPLNANIIPPTAEIKDGLINWYRENGLSAQDIGYMSTKQLKALYAETVALDPTFVKRFKIFQAQMGYLSEDMIARSFAEKALEKGLRGISEIKAYMLKGGLNDYRVAKYITSREFEEALGFYKELDNVLGFPKMF